MGQSTRQSVLFSKTFAKPVVATFDGEAETSDAGLAVFAALDRRLGLTARLAACLQDRRDPKRVEHGYAELFRQRVFSIACGYADGNDAASVAVDPVLKEACGRRALSGAALGSQPTLSRFENSVTGRELVAMVRALEDAVIERHRERLRGKPRLITLDFDSTDDPTHGQQAFAFFHAHYDEYCYLPLLGFITFDDEREQHLIHARLRPGTSRDYRGLFPLIRRLVGKLRSAFPRARIRVRMDAGFGCSAVFDVLDALRVEYVVAFAQNKTLLKDAEPLLAAARAAVAQTGETSRRFGEVSYRAGTWSRARRVVIKGEVLAGRPPRDNARFVVTNSRRSPERVYTKDYCARCDSENRIKELHALELGRTSCSRFLANQLRVLMTATAYVIYQEMRLRLANTAFARAQVPTLRERLIKIGGRVVESVRRVVLHLPVAFPWKDAWCQLARAAGAT